MGLVFDYFRLWSISRSASLSLKVFHFDIIIHNKIVWQTAEYIICEKVEGRHLL